MKKADKKHLTTGKSGYIFYQRRCKKTGCEKPRYYFSLRTKDLNEAMKLRDQYDYELQKYGTILNEPEENNTMPLFCNLCAEWYEDKKIDPDVEKTH
jgi:hypothetical protein